MPFSPTSSHIPTHLFDLPTELLRYIFSFLHPATTESDHPGSNHAAFIALSCTSRFVRELVASTAPLVPSPLIHPPPPPLARHFGRGVAQLKKKALLYDFAREDELRELNTNFFFLLEEWDWWSVPLPSVIRSPRPRSSTTSSEDEIRENRQRWQSHIPPLSRHACFNCFRLLPSSAFATSQVSGDCAKRRDLPNPFDFKQMPSHLKKARVKRFCIDCGIQDGHYKNQKYPIRFVVGWERGAEGEGYPNAGSVGNTVGADAEGSSGRGLPADKGGADSRGKPELATGFVCQRWTCSRFVVAEIGGRDEEVERGVESPEFLRKTCTRCLEYRRPGGENAPARGHVMR